MADMVKVNAIQPKADAIRSRPVRDCYLCGAEGRLLYVGLRDRLFNAPGEWTMVECPRPDCGLAWLNPMPLETDIGVAYQEYYTHLNPSQVVASGSSRNQGLLGRWLGKLSQFKRAGYLANVYGYDSGAVSRWQRRLGWVMYLQPTKQVEVDSDIMYLTGRAGSLLEVGCGNGDLLRRMQGLGWRVEGVESDPQAAALVSSVGLPVWCGSVEDRRYPSDHFDAVVMSHVIEHVLDPSALLRECRRILKPNGRLVITTPNKASWAHRLYQETWMPLDPPRHSYLFSRQAVDRLTRSVGLQPLRLATTIRNADGIFLASRDITREGRHLWGTQYSRGSRAWGRALQLVESAMLWWKPNSGEEIVFVGTK